jgi:hypothetical protein
MSGPQNGGPQNGGAPDKRRVGEDSLDAVIAKEHLQAVLDYLRNVKFGTITLVIHDGKVVQIEKLEKIRL